MGSNRAVALVIATLCLACASAGRIDEEIRITDESAIIIWDEITKTQHFIRRASFRTRAKDFGFLVPTPTVPNLTEANDLAFTHLEEVTTVPSLTKGVALGRGAEASKASVVVIERARVAGLDAAVLKTSDPEALGAWLKANGYASTPELMEWAAYYIEKRWIITAFKIAAVQGSHQLDTSAVRMSFQTEQPFFPYREPAQTSLVGSRVLNVYFLSNARAEATIGGAAAWPGRAVQSFELSESDLGRLKELLKLPYLRADLRRLTFFIDPLSLRPGREDLFFSRAVDQSIVTPQFLAEQQYERMISREAGERSYELMKRKEREEQERQEAYMRLQQKDEVRNGAEARQAIALRSAADSVLWIVLAAIVVTVGILLLRRRRRKGG